jgi:DnaJ-class molecular chaperone
MNPVTRERAWTCVRCHERFTEPAGTVTRICDDCSGRGAGEPPGAADGTASNRDRNRTCVRCGGECSAVPGEVSCRCPSCDPDRVLLD